MDKRTAKQLLSQPLRFGDIEQIKAMRVVEEGPRKYKVTLDVMGRATITIDAAESEDDACDKAEQLFDGCLDDYDITHSHAKEVDG